MPSSDIVGLCMVAASPIALVLALAWVLVGGTLRGRRAVDPSDDDARVDRPEVSQRHELAVQLSIGFALVSAGGLVGWAYLASAVHHG